MTLTENENVFQNALMSPNNIMPSLGQCFSDKDKNYYVKKWIIPTLLYAFIEKKDNFGK